jgi:DNA (cytosine-5)-methyltransferase 1
MHKGINTTLDEGRTPVVTHALRGEGFDASEDGTGRGTRLVPVSIGFNARQDPDAWRERTGPLDTDGGTQAVGTDLYNGAITGDVAETLSTGSGTGVEAGPSVMQPVAFQSRINRNGRGNMGDVVNALQAQSGQTGKGDAAPCVATAMQVRRLTPVECERLQGFPDGYTAIPWRGKPSDQCPDGPRYKALGNSWAVPVVRWIGQRINTQLENQ